MPKRHITEQYYSIHVETEQGKKVFFCGFDGTAEKLAQTVNKLTNKTWKKIRIYKYVQNIDLQKQSGTRIVGKKHSVLKIDRLGYGSLCTKVDENFMRDGKIPANILAFFGEYQK